MYISQFVQKSQRSDLFFFLAFVGVWLHLLVFTCSPASPIRAILPHLKLKTLQVRTRYRIPLSP